MALIDKNITGDIHGSYANITHVNSRFGRYIKKKSRPTNRRTAKQQNSKDKYHKVNIMWAKLTTAQHQQWLKFADIFIHRKSILIESL